MTSPYTLPNGREITSEVLMKLEPSVLPHLPVACKTCPGAMWQVTGKSERPDQLTARCYCRIMHTFTWDSRTREEILDCDQLYEPEDEEEGGPTLTDDLPPFLRQQHQQSPQQPTAPEPIRGHLDEDIPLPEIPDGLRDAFVEP
ncbi:hypothetical protein [Pseudomonas chlororaphis]|uniref:hypothetical protein n=1 Tax=Pseudomonas chlororaphis TaxID=587753 RepID=UPI002D7804FD|nr:hypothetical protein [Pseudomonas chlororaphis]